jgi:hypothetical protein
MDDVFGLYLALYFVLLVGIIQLAVYFIAKLSGWSRLAKIYRCHERSLVNFRQFQSMRLGVCNYSTCMSFALSSEGFYMKVFFLFSTGHSPLLIPWNVFVDGGRPRWNIFYGRVFYINTDYRKIKIFLSKKIAHEIISNGYVKELTN